MQVHASLESCDLKEQIEYETSPRREEFTTEDNTSDIPPALHQLDPSLP